MFTKADWFSKISPRLGFSHVITDKATFSFNYGVYYQTPIYQNIYLNTNRLDDPEELFEETKGIETFINTKYILNNYGNINPDFIWRAVNFTKWMQVNLG